MKLFDIKIYANPSSVSRNLIYVRYTDRYTYGEVNRSTEVTDKLTVHIVSCQKPNISENHSQHTAITKTASVTAAP